MMQTTISARHCEVTESLQERAMAVTGRLAQLSPHALEATVIFDEGPLAHTVEIRLHARGRKMLVGVGEGTDHRTALDRAEEKLRPQILKADRGRPRARRAPTGEA
jgi:ribosome-associated translation inhibitor RaiA